MKKTFFMLIAAMLTLGIAHAKQTIVKNGKPTARIVTNGSDAVNREAAKLLQDFVQRIS